MNGYEIYLYSMYIQNSMDKWMNDGFFSTLKRVDPLDAGFLYGPGSGDQKRRQHRRGVAGDWWNGVP